MSKAPGARHSAFSGDRMRGLDLRAIDHLGIKRPFRDAEAARAEPRSWGGTS